MSDSEDSDKCAALREIKNEIQKYKKNPETAGMFVSGWEDDGDGIPEINLEKIKANPSDHVLWAAENGELETLKKLLESKPSLVHSQDSDGYTPLHRAAYSNQLAVICHLLSCGAKVSAKTELGWTPLHSACKWNNYAAAARLLAAGADPKAESDGEQTPLHLVSSIGQCKATLLVLFLRDDVIDLAEKPNKAGETPKNLARGHGIYEPLFEMVLPAATYIKSLAFTCNPYMREEAANT